MDDTDEVIIEGDQDFLNQFQDALIAAHDDLVNLKSKSINTSNNNRVAVEIYDSRCAEYISKHTDVLLSVLEWAMLTGIKETNTKIN